MSGPMPPPFNQMFGNSRRGGPPTGPMPMGQTRKPGGAERVPMSSDPPARSPQAQRIIEANRRGVPPQSIVQGAPRPPVPAQTLPRPQSTPMPTSRPPMADGEVNPQPMRPGQTPMPMGRPQGAPTLDPTQRIQQGADSRLNDMSYTGPNQAALTRGLQIQGQQRLQDPKAPVNQQSFGSMLMRALSNRFGSGADPNAPLPPATTGPSSTPSSGPTPEFPREDARQKLIEEIARRNKAMSGDKQSSAEGMRGVPVMAQGGDDEEEESDPRTLVMQAATQQGPVWYDRPPDLGKQKKGKKGEEGIKYPKPFEKGKKNSDNYYSAAGVTRGDNTGVANVLKALRAKAKATPSKITPEEDRILATYGDEGYLYPIDDKSIMERFRQYGVDQKKIDEAKAQGKFGQRPQERINERFPGAGPQSTVVYGAKPLPQDGVDPDDAVIIAKKAIDAAGNEVKTERRPPFNQKQAPASRTAPPPKVEKDADPTTDDEDDE